MRGDKVTRREADLRRNQFLPCTGLTLANDDQTAVLKERSHLGLELRYLVQ